MKMLWSGIRSVINIKQSTLSGIPQLIVDRNKITEPKEIASSLNKYFVNVRQQINKDTPRTKKSPMDYLNDPVGNSFFLSLADTKEIESIILSFNNRKVSWTIQYTYKTSKNISKCDIRILFNDSK